jgi:NADPH-dependent curcumin reductase CurA
MKCVAPFGTALPNLSSQLQMKLRMETKRQSVVLLSRPAGSPHVSNFAVVEDEIPALRDGEVLNQTLWLSLDP